MHYNHWRKYGDPCKGKFRPKGALCSLEDCDKPVYGNGYCEMHNARMRRNGDPRKLVVVRYDGAECEWQECTKRPFSKNLCRLHYFRMANAKRKARLMAATVAPYGSDDIAARFSFFGNRCWMCGTTGRLDMDHVKPLSKGGKDCPANIRPACAECNSRKNNRWHGVSELHRFLKH